MSFFISNNWLKYNHWSFSIIVIVKKVRQNLLFLCHHFSYRFHVKVKDWVFVLHQIDYIHISMRRGLCIGWAIKSPRCKINVMPMAERKIFHKWHVWHELVGNFNESIKHQKGKKKISIKFLSHINRSFEVFVVFFLLQGGIRVCLHAIDTLFWL